MSSGFTQEKVDRLADLLLIGLTPEENKMLFEEFETIDANISNNITQIEGIEKVVPMTHALDDFTCVLREDVIEESVPIEDALSNCDVVDGREPEVPKVVG